MTAANRTLALDNILQSEGGFTDHPADPGGPTNYGITLATLSAWRDHPCTAEDVRNLAVTEARAIIGSQYADKVAFDLLPVGLDYMTVDFAVHSGPYRSARTLQEVLGFTGNQLDGSIGTKTLRAIAAINNQEELLHRYSEARLSYMHSLKNWSTFGKGWTNRVTRVEGQAERMLQGQPLLPLGLLDVDGMAKATGPVKITNTVSGIASIASLSGAGLVAAGTAASAIIQGLSGPGGAAQQATAILQPYDSIGAVHLILVALALLTAAGPFVVAVTRAAQGQTT